jgi:hypothetical protein
MRILCKWTECTDLQRCNWYGRGGACRRPVLLSACFTARWLILRFIEVHVTWPVCIRSEPQLFNRASNSVLFRFCKTQYNLTQMQGNLFRLAKLCNTQSFVLKCVKVIRRIFAVIYRYQLELLSDVIILIILTNKFHKRLFLKLTVAQLLNKYYICKCDISCVFKFKRK